MIFRIKIKTDSIGIGEGSQFSIPHGGFWGCVIDGVRRCSSE